MSPGLSGEIEAARAAGAALRESVGEVASYDLRLGRYQDVLADVEVDAVICDPPYSERTHDGHANAWAFDGYEREAMDFPFWTRTEIESFATRWASTQGWIVALTDSDLFPAWRETMHGAGRCTFQPIPCVMPAMTVRLAGDGPSSWTVYAAVSRPRNSRFVRWGSLPGAYWVGQPPRGGQGRGKPLDLMRKIVSDYSRPGDLVCDPTAGYGSTLAASLQKGRRAIGAECEADVYAEARRRLDLIMAGPADLFDPRSAWQEGLGL